MPRYEYKVVPAPTRAAKVKGVKGTEARFAAALSDVMNRMAAEGWEYQRTDTLPCEERKGLTGRVTTFQNMLVFRRAPDAGAAPDTVAIAPETAERILAIPSFRATARLEGPGANGHPEGRAPTLRAVPDAPAKAPPLGAATRDDA